MKYVCDGPGGKTWFRMETEAEADQESALMQHAVEKHFRREMAKATAAYKPKSTVFIEQNIGLAAHLQRRMPLFLTLRDGDGNGLATAMLPPAGAMTKTLRSSSWERKIAIRMLNMQMPFRRLAPISA